MIIIGMDNTLERAADTILFIMNAIKGQGLKCEHIAPRNQVFYKKNKLLSITQYIKELEKKDEVDLVIIEVTKEGIGTGFYKHIYFNSFVLFEKENKRRIRGYWGEKIKNDLKYDYLVIPDTYVLIDNRSITYGWGRDAHVSLTSSEKGPEGALCIQCLLQHKFGDVNELSIPGEFPICGRVKREESLLAAITILLLFKDKLLFHYNI